MSQNGNKRAASGMTEAQEQKVRSALERTFRSISSAGPANQDRRTHDFVFHLIDWYEDLVRLADAMEHPDTTSDEAWSEAVMGLLIHVSGHLATAVKIAEVMEPIEFDIPQAKPASKKLPAAPRM